MNRVKGIAIGSDHNGFAYKEELKKYLTSKGYRVKDFGQFEGKTPARSYKFVEEAGKAVSSKALDRGILICGSGDGMCIAANKIPGCIASLCYNKFAAEVARKRNNSNIITFGSKTMDLELVKEMLDIWLTTDFEEGPGEERNIARFEDLLRVDREHRI